MNCDPFIRFFLIIDSYFAYLTFAIQHHKFSISNMNIFHCSVENRNLPDRYFTCLSSFFQTIAFGRCNTGRTRKMWQLKFIAPGGFTTDFPSFFMQITFVVNCFVELWAIIFWCYLVNISFRSFEFSHE